MLVEHAEESYRNTREDLRKNAVGDAQVRAARIAAYNAEEIVSLVAQTALESAQSAKALGKRLNFAALAQYCHPQSQ